MAPDDGAEVGMLLRKLTERQIECGMSDGAFAAVLGIPRSTWQATRTGALPLGRTVVQAARRTFPELAADCVVWLLEDAKLLADVAG